MTNTRRQKVVVRQISSARSIVLPQPNNHIFVKEVERTSKSAGLPKSDLMHSKDGPPASSRIVVDPKTRRAWQEEMRRSLVVSTTSKDSKGGKKSKKLADSEIKRVPFRLRIDKNLEDSREEIKKKTERIKSGWLESNRQYIKSGTYIRGISHSKKLENNQWLSFEGTSPGLLGVFTEGEAEALVCETPHFSVEAEVGKKISKLIEVGTKVRIGKNGQRIHINKTEQTEDTDFYDRCDEVMMMTRSDASKAEPLFPPLCLADLESVKQTVTPSAPPNSKLEFYQNHNVTNPVVFNDPAISSSVYITPGRIDQTEVEKVLSKSQSKKVFSRINGHTDRSHAEPTTPSYEDILTHMAPNSSREIYVNKAEFGNSGSGSEITIPSPTHSLSLDTARTTPRNKSVPAPILTQVLREGLPRQCSVPTTLRGDNSPAEELHRSVSLIDSPHRLNNSRSSTRPQGLGKAVVRSDEKTYVNIVTPLSKTNQDRDPMFGYSKDMQGGYTSISNNPNMIEGIPITGVKLVGKPHPMEKRATTTHQSRRTNHSELYDSSPAPLIDNNHIDISNLRAETATRLDVSIPMMDLESTSSIITS